MHRSEVIVESVLEGGGPDVAILIPVPLDPASDRCYHDEVPDIEFPSLIKEWFL